MDRPLPERSPAIFDNIGRPARAVAGGACVCVRACALAAAIALGACATAIPLPSFMGVGNDVTGSIPPPSAALSPFLDQEDWRRAKGALGIALDPQGNGAAVAWENPRSGARGSFTPVADAKAVDDKICRAFLAEVGGAAPARSLQGAACRDKAGEWTLGDVKPWTARAS
jgi:surface antigen